MDSSDLNQFIAVHNIEAVVVHLPVDTPTVPAAAEALNVRPEQIIKSMLFMAQDNPILVVTNGEKRIDRKLLGAVLGMSRRRVKIASSDQVSTITGYVVGAVPPFGHLTGIPTLIDTGVLAESTVYGGGGESNALMRISTVELRRITVADVVDIVDR